MCSSRLGGFVASWIRGWPNVSSCPKRCHRFLQSCVFCPGPRGHLRFLLTRQTYLRPLGQLLCWEADLIAQWEIFFSQTGFSSVEVGSPNPVTRRHCAFQHGCQLLLLFADKTSSQEVVTRHPLCRCLVYWYFVFLCFAPDCFGVVKGKSNFCQCDLEVSIYPLPVAWLQNRQWPSALVFITAGPEGWPRSQEPHQGDAGKTDVQPAYSEGMSQQGLMQSAFSPCNTSRF